MPTNFPQAVSTNGTMLVKFVPAFVNYLVPKLTEINAAGAVLLTGALTGDGFTNDTNENNIDDPRLASKQIFESPGDYTRSMELKYVYNPAAPSEDVVRLALPKGTRGFLLVRWAVDSDDVIAIGDEVDVAPVTMGVQRKQTPARNGVHTIMQKPFITGEIAENVLVVA